MTLIDVSRTLTAETAVWPGDTPFRLHTILARQEGEGVNLTTLTLSAHTGSHVDAPYHFADEGTTVDALLLEPYWGRAQVITVEREHGPLQPEDLEAYDIGRARRLLVRSAGGVVDQTVFPEVYVYPSPELARWLGRRGIILFGSDAPSMDAVDSKTLPGHNALRREGIAILEWLDLSGALDGLYELAALPLKIAGGDGSPVRAVLRTLG